MQDGFGIRDARSFLCCLFMAVACAKPDPSFGLNVLTSRAGSACLAPGAGRGLSGGASVCPNFSETDTDDGCGADIAPWVNGVASPSTVTTGD